MKYKLDLNDRPFDAIAAGTKKIEGRVPTSWDKTPYDRLQAGDIITFERSSDKAVMDVEVIYVRHYPTVRSMLEAEGTENVLSSRGTIEQGVESYHSFPEYKENILKHGIYAIRVKPVA